MKAVFRDNAINIGILTLKSTLELFSAGAPPGPRWGSSRRSPDPLSPSQFPPPRRLRRLGLAPSAPLLRFTFCGVQKIVKLYYVLYFSVCIYISIVHIRQVSLLAVGMSNTITFVLS